jgi:uncharacterized protein YndB with AHSA1/START domain
MSPLLTIERTFAAPPARVFDAWVHPEVLRRWWAASPNWRSPSAEVDARAGGCYRLSMEDAESGHVHTVVGEYLEVERPHRLVYSWTWEGEPVEMAGSERTIVTVEFHAAGDRTRVVLTHRGFTTDHVRDLHAGGWGACLDNLGDRVFPDAVGQREQTR